jgi:hypothetical protein
MSPAPRLPARLDRCSLSLDVKAGRWRTNMGPRKEGVSHTPNALDCHAGAQHAGEQ